MGKFIKHYTLPSTQWHGGHNFPTRVSFDELSPFKRSSLPTRLHTFRCTIVMRRKEQQTFGLRVDFSVVCVTRAAV